jgi:hypothetical protein
MGIAAAAFHWTAADFRAATPHEFFAAFEVWKTMNEVPGT